MWVGMIAPHIRKEKNMEFLYYIAILERDGEVITTDLIDENQIEEYRAKGCKIYKYYREELREKLYD